MKKAALILSWALYDLANQFFALNMVSLYFVRWVTVEKGAPELFYGIAFAASTLFVAAASPVLGTVSDITGRHRLFLTGFTLVSVVFTMLLAVCGNVFLGLAFFAIANFGCQGAIVFYNALMISIAPKGKIGLVSGLGKMLGYAGAVISLYLFKPVVMARGYQAVFFPTGALFLVFALPCLLFVKDKNPRPEVRIASFFGREKLAQIFGRLKEVFLDSRKFPGMTDFLKASFCILCAVNVIIIFMAVYATKVFHLDEARITKLIMFSTVFAMAGSIVSGYISDRLGSLRSLTAIFVLWGISFSAGAFLRTENLYWMVGALVGVSLGSVWVVLRAIAVKIVPAERIGEMFGLFNVVGYLSGGVGALSWGALLLVLSPLEETGYRIALFSLNIFLIFGFVFLLRMNKKKVLS